MPWTVSDTYVIIQTVRTVLLLKFCTATYAVFNETGKHDTWYPYNMSQQDAPFCINLSE